MIKMTDELQKIIDKCSDSHQYMEINSLILGGEYKKAFNKLMKEFSLTKEEAQTLIDYYQECASEKYSIIEIDSNEAMSMFLEREQNNPHPNDPMKSFEYHSQFKFLVLNGYGLKEVSFLLKNGNICFMDSSTYMYVEVSKVRQIWKIER